MPWLLSPSPTQCSPTSCRSFSAPEHLSFVDIIIAAASPPLRIATPRPGRPPSNSSGNIRTRCLHPAVEDHHVFPLDERFPPRPPRASRRRCAFFSSEPNDQPLNVESSPTLLLVLTAPAIVAPARFVPDRRSEQSFRGARCAIPGTISVDCAIPDPDACVFESRATASCCSSRPPKFPAHPVQRRRSRETR